MNAVQEKPIAVLASNFAETVVWINANFKVRMANLARRRFELEDGRVLVIVTHFEQAYGMQFCEYVKAPNYVTLEDIVRSRVV